MNLFLFPWEAYLVLAPLGLLLALLGLAQRRPADARAFRQVALGCLAVGAVLLVGGLLVGATPALMGDSVQTSPAAIPPLQSRVYTVAPANDILREAVLAVEAQRSWFRPWRVTRRDQTPLAGGQIQVQIAGWVWTDTLVANIRPEANGVQVDATSRSPAGRLALGAPRRHVAQFLAALDARVAALGQ